MVKLASLHFQVAVLAGLVSTGLSSTVTRRAGEQLFRCGVAFYSKSNYTCYDSTFLCPVIEGQPTLRCNRDCYLPYEYL